MNRFGHLDLRVSDLAAAMPFYQALLPSLGYAREFHSPAWKVFAAEGQLPAAPYVAITEDAAHVANANRVAFWAADPAGVDAAAEAVRRGGGQDVDGPAWLPEFGEGKYYAVYFNDPCGNRFEVYYRTV